MRESLLILFDNDLALANDVFNRLAGNKPACDMLRAALVSATDQKKSVIKQYEARISACDIVMYAVGLNDPLIDRISRVKADYKKGLNNHKSTLWYKIKKFLGFLS